MEMKVNVVYEITERESWRSGDGIRIKSNIADDSLIECELAKSLVENLKTESVVLNPDKLLLGFAEAQKRGIEENLEALNDLELNAKNRADSIHEKILKSCDDSEEKYLEIEKKFSEISKRFTNNVEASKKALETQMTYLNSVYEKLSKVDNYSLERLGTTLEKIITLVESDAELVKLVLKNKK